jgi:hypothetical protein
VAVSYRLVAIGLIAGLLAACTSGGAAPTPTSSPSRHTSERPTTTGPESPTATARTGPLTTGPNVRPGEKPPEFPDLARRHTANGALAFAAYYYEAYDWGYATNDPYLVEQISAPSCTACSRYVKGLEGATGRHEVVHGGRVSFRSASIFHGVLDIDADFAVDIEIDEQPIVLEKPHAPRRTVAKAVTRYHSLVFVAWQTMGWRIVEVTDK